MMRKMKKQWYYIKWRAIDANVTGIVEADLGGYEAARRALARAKREGRQPAYEFTIEKMETR